ncbi:MAG TPA: hypothetical protein VN856_13740 [Mycobacterium sp.]|jgi:hypothetical protein|uniref:hypothetical protein n=1 Tax=Mycobacterium sp. TaxID=1785 RepID=UPI002C6BF3AB|nr:hypothetical protein [Mycobacterium sp.]HXO80939.1 hypothetical protein [Mycobacterium sp.]
MPSKAVPISSVPVPAARPGMPTKLHDARRAFAKITSDTPRDDEAERAFLAAKIHVVRTHPRLDRHQRASAYAELVERVGHQRLHDAEVKGGPVPGGVGYGFFYDDPFKQGFAQGTSLYWEIVCPNPPGGNVNTYLYLTAMNRAAEGVEAFVSYNGQNEPHFRVFDWARSDHWQTDRPFGTLTDYLDSTTTHGRSYQTLGVWNSTYQISATQWRNEALLWNRSANRWDLFYRYDYAATQAGQTAGYTGSWGPIVETFQPNYYCTQLLGGLSTMLITRSESGAWGTWQLLSATDSWVRTDNVGFNTLFLDPNYALVVHS